MLGPLTAEFWLEIVANWNFTMALEWLGLANSPLSHPILPSSPEKKVLKRTLQHTYIWGHFTRMGE